MKKFAIILSAAVAVLGFASCSQDKDPQYNVPTEFKLNVPPFATQTYELDAENEILITCSQPDYGYSAVTNYSAEVSLTPDFATCEPVKSIDGTKAAMRFRDVDFATAINVLFGITNEEEWAAHAAANPSLTTKLYVRAVAQLTNIESSVIRSNSFEMPYVKYFYSVPKPAVIYCIGNYAGAWIAPTADQAEALAPYALSEAEDAIGSKIFQGTIEFDGEENGKPLDALIFRFYTELTGWDGDEGAGIPCASWGCGAGTGEDKPVSCKFTSDGEYEGTVAEGKSSFQFSGINHPVKIQMTVDMNEDVNTAVFKIVK